MSNDSNCSVVHFDPVSLTVSATATDSNGFNFSMRNLNFDFTAIAGAVNISDYENHEITMLSCVVINDALTVGANDRVHAVVPCLNNEHAYHTISVGDDDNVDHVEYHYFGSRDGTEDAFRLASIDFTALLDVAAVSDSSATNIALVYDAEHGANVTLDLSNNNKIAVFVAHDHETHNVVDGADSAFGDVGFDFISLTPINDIPDLDLKLFYIASPVEGAPEGTESFAIEQDYVVSFDII